MGLAKKQRTNLLIKNTVGMTVVKHIESKIRQLQSNQVQRENNRFDELVQTGFFIEARNERELESILV